VKNHRFTNAEFSVTVIQVEIGNVSVRNSLIETHAMWVYVIEVESDGISLLFLVIIEYREIVAYSMYYIYTRR